MRAKQVSLVLVVVVVVAVAAGLFARGVGSVGSTAAPSGAAVAHVGANPAPAVAGSDGFMLTIGTHRAHVLQPPGQVRAASMRGTLNYHFGPVMQTSVVNHIVLWNPGLLQDGSATGYSSKYVSLATQWFADQSASSLYANLNQYYQIVKSKFSYILPNAKVPKIVTDTDPFPTGQCVNRDTGANCITDANVVAELQHLVAVDGLPGGLKNEYFVLTPAGEGSCFDTACGFESYTFYCAYHSFTTTTPAGKTDLIYANMPYPTDPAGNNCYDPSAGQTFPNGDTDADANVNVMSHEQYESVSDPLLNAWYDGSGAEVGDVCLWQFGAAYPSGGDLQINGHPYDTQSEGDNHNYELGGNGCVMAGP